MKVATTSSTTTEKPPAEAAPAETPAVPEVSAEDVKKVQEDPRFDLPANRVRTAEDAYQAFLREEITEGELRAVVATTGNPKFAALKSNLERPDNAFTKKVPEDLYEDSSLAVSSVEDRIKTAEEKAAAAEAATKEAEAAV